MIDNQPVWQISAMIDRVLISSAAFSSIGQIQAESFALGKIRRRPDDSSELVLDEIQFADSLDKACSPGDRVVIFSTSRYPNIELAQELIAKLRPSKTDMLLVWVVQFSNLDEWVGVAIDGGLQHIIQHLRVGDLDSKWCEPAKNGDGLFNSSRVTLFGTNDLLGILLATTIAGLGIRQIRLVDHRRISECIDCFHAEPNGKFGVEVLARNIATLFPDIAVSACRERPASYSKIPANSDLCICCGDNLSLRLAAATFSKNANIPFLDLNVIEARESFFLARVRLFLNKKDRGCIVCQPFLEPDDKKRAIHDLIAPKNALKAVESSDSCTCPKYITTPVAAQLSAITARLFRDLSAGLIQRSESYSLEIRNGTSTLFKHDFLPVECPDCGG